jgi:hypothetical protein
MKIKAYTLFTESHKKFFTDYFLPTFPFRKEIELTILYKEQHCKTVVFESDGWHKTMQDKAECFINGIEKCNNDEIFMFIDPDIQFFGDFYDDILSLIQNYDVLWQNDVIGGVNTGFFAVKNNKKTRSFFKTIVGNLHKFSQEQVLANYLLSNVQQYPSIDIKWTYLPERYWTYGYIVPLPSKAHPEKIKGGIRGHWSTETDDFDIPKDIKIHHANWTSSYEDKFKLLDIVKSKHAQMLNKEL